MEKEFIVHLGEFGEHSVLEFDADMLMETCKKSNYPELKEFSGVLEEMFKKDNIVEADIFDSALSQKGLRIKVQQLQYILEELTQNGSLFSFLCIRCQKRHDGKELKCNSYKFNMGKEYSCPKGHYIWNVTHNS